MITASTVYDSCLALIKKDKRGRAFTVDEYNSISALVNMELYNSYVSKYENSKEVSDELVPFKVRGHTVTLTSGVGFIPGEADRIAGNPWIAHPWGVITATAEVDVKGYADTKVKITSSDHGLKDGAVITVTGLSTHTITAKPIFYIDKNSFWVDVNYAAADVLTSAAWTVVGASYKEVDLTTEKELSNRWADHLTKPSIQNPVYVIDTGNSLANPVGFYAPQGMYSTGHYGRGYTLNHGLKVGDIINLYGVVDAVGVATSAYFGAYRIFAIIDDNNFIFEETYSAIPVQGQYNAFNIRRINVYPTTIPTVNINYLRYPKTPFLDYYVDANYVIYYLDAYSFSPDIYTSHALALGEEYRDGTAGTNPATTIYSWTVDWEWDADLLPQIVYMILTKAGINLENMNLTQISAQLQTKEESQV